jgi:hypothetical protein
MFSNVLHRLKQVIKWLGPVAILCSAIIKGTEIWEVLQFWLRKFLEWGVAHFLVSPLGLFIIGVLWMTVLILWPRTLKWRLHLALRGEAIRAWTWINEGDRHELLHTRLKKCRSGEKVQFISFTGKSVVLPEVPAGKELGMFPFPAAVSRGVHFQGLLLDPLSTEAKFRSIIETPNKPEDQRLLQSHAREVAGLRARYYEQAGIERDITAERVKLKYISLGLPFSLWLFNDVALLEPYHVGKRPKTGNLCEFAQMIVPRGEKGSESEINYQILEDHFQTLWNADDLWKQQPRLLRAVWP